MQTRMESRWVWGWVLPLLCGLLALWGGGWSDVAIAQTPSRREIAPAVRAATASPVQDDATLHSITFLGSQFGCTVGDRGTCWITRDGGRTWSFSPTPVKCALRGVHFLTDRVGWAVGGEVAPYTRFASGVVIQTTDGGQSWQLLSQHTTPPLSYVHFLDKDLGIAVGEASSSCASGVFATADGGKTWTATDGPRATTWKAAAMLPNGAGVVTGPRGEWGILGRGQLVRTVDTLKGLRGFNAASLHEDGTGWMVGDGGWVLQTRNSGTSWSTPAGEMPAELRDCMEFQAVAQMGENVWIAGAPGSVVWHSADGGQHWQAQPTGQTTPLRSLCFTDERNGVAVGDLGKILSTSDGGQTWTAIRGGDRRLAVLMIHAHPQQVSLGLTAYFAGEWGYRAGVILLTRRDLGSDALRNSPLQFRLDDAYSVVGGNHASIDWRLPITVPGLDRHRDHLIDEWLLLTDQNLPQVVTTDLVAKIRMWQPEVVLITKPTEEDATSRIAWDAVQDAVAAAADPALHSEMESLIGLAPWQVKKVFSHAPGERGSENILSQNYLVRAGVTIDQWAEPAAARLFESSEAAIRNEGLTLVHSVLENQKVAAQSMFGGLEIPEGGPARRTLLPVSLDNIEERKNQVTRRIAFFNAAGKMMESSSHGSEVIAQLVKTTEDLPPDQGAKLLSDIARGYQERMLWDSAEQTNLLLLDLYPDHPAATNSAAWLLRFWTSAEMNWQRLRPRISKKTESGINPAIAQAGFQSRLRNNQKLPGELADPEIEPEGAEFQNVDSAVRVKPKTFNDIVGSDTTGADVVTMQAEQWQAQATKISSLVEKTSPGFFREPDVQLSLAALLRRRSRHSDADRVVGQLLKQDGKDPWHQVAQGEAWILNPQARSPRPVIICRKTSLPPRLDGKLTDVCWEGASEVRLTDQPPPAADGEFVGAEGLGSKAGLQIVGPQGMVMLLYDDRFLYLAGSLPRAEGQLADPPQTAGRTPDTDLARHDRMSFQFDTDRDYNTFYRFDIDQRGCTQDACWESNGWNPKWYVATYGDDQVWRFETAIPWEALVPTPPSSGTFWATGMTRIIPKVGLQGWNHPLTETPTAQTFGLLRFE